MKYVFLCQNTTYMHKSNFSDWTLDTIDEAFGTKQIFVSEKLNKWLSDEYEANEYERKYLLHLQSKLVLGGDSWNEVELENKFISPVFMFADFDNPEFSYFLERDMKTKIGEYEISGRIDGMIATGYRNPKKPFFCLNEYKKQRDPDGEPQGQCLIAMLAAQEKNQNQNPIYGCFIIGKFWRFMILEGTTYCMSKFYTADDEEIFDIFRILKGLKAIIEGFVREDEARLQK